jgi:LysR family transcriptional regulator (chromosome initiation inhibitor)
MQLDYTHLATLAAILRCGSFEGAASDLSLTQSAISQRLKALEERVGTLLVHRTNPCTGTDAGRRLAAHADHVGLLEQTLHADIAALAPLPKSRLRLAVNADSLATWFLDALQQLPDHLFDLTIDDQDFSADWLKRGEVAGAVTAHATPITGCDSHALGSLRYLATASPAYMARHFAEGVTPATIARAPMLRFDQKDELQRHWIKRYVGTASTTTTAATPPSHGLPSSQGFVEASLRGLGWGMNPEPLVRAHITAGRLVEIMPDAPFDTPLYWQSSRLLRTALTPLTRAIRQTARLGLRQGGRQAG